MARGIKKEPEQGDESLIETLDTKEKKKNEEVSDFIYSTGHWFICVAVDLQMISFVVFYQSLSTLTLTHKAIECAVGSVGAPRA